jgi:hypothetical protein
MSWAAAPMKARDDGYPHESHTRQEPMELTPSNRSIVPRSRMWWCMSPWKVYADGYALGIENHVTTAGISQVLDMRPLA